MKKACLYLLLVCVCISTQSVSQILIHNVTIVDVENKKLFPAQDVLVNDGTITNIGKKLGAPASTQIIDGSGKWLMPGFVDAHVHFFQSGGLYTRPDAIDLRKVRPYEKELEWTHQNMESLLRRYAMAGITTVIDVGASVKLLVQRDSFRTKSYAPAIYMTGPLITTYEPAAFKGLGDEAPFYLMKTADEGRAYVQKQLPFKPDFIKIWYIALGNADSSAKANLPLVQAVIDEAHKNGLRVAVHATEETTATLAVQAGADYLVHDVEDRPVSDAFVQLLKSKGTVLSPTLVVASNYVRALGQQYRISADDFRYAHPTPVNSMLDMAGLKDTALVNRYKKGIANNAAAIKKEDSIRSINLKKMMNAGVIIATGTDAGNIGTQHVSSYYDELRAMQAAGMSTWDLLQSSTINGAKAIGKQNEFGSVKKGMRADLLLLSKNPVENIGNWQSIEWVINKGMASKPDSFLKPSPIELANQQLLGYNAHSLEAFLAPYSEDVEIYDLSTNEMQIKGKAPMRKQYSFLSNIGKLHCNVVNRIADGRFVIDHEEIITANGVFYGIAIYEVKDGQIIRVWFPDRK
jgi:imidazolonepropionase-like amidohydrolase